MKKWIKYQIGAWACLAAILPVLFICALMDMSGSAALLVFLSLLIAWIVLLVKSFKMRKIDNPDVQGKKWISTIAIVLLSCYGIYATIGANVVQKNRDDLAVELQDYKEKYKNLQEEYDRLVLAASVSKSENLQESTKTDSIAKSQEEAPAVLDGSSRSNPIIVTTSQFAKEINSNIDNAKEKYNGKWIQITGKVNSAHSVAGMTSFYLYGEKGGAGLKIVSWVNKEVIKPFDYKGETHTFLGKVREVTTVNATEIGDCEIVE